MNEQISNEAREYLSTIGKKGGAIKGGRKALASQINGLKGGRKKQLNYLYRQRLRTYLKKYL